MGLKPGDHIDFVRRRSGAFVIEKINTDFRSRRGILKSRRTKSLTVREMDEAIARGVLGR